MVDIGTLPAIGAVPWTLNPALSAIKAELDGRLSDTQLRADFAPTEMPTFFKDVHVQSDQTGGLKSTDSTGRVNLHSWQQADSPTAGQPFWTGHFGEVMRIFSHHAKSKQMLAWYGPTAFNADGTPATPYEQWKPWVWIGAHFAANRDSDELPGAPKQHRHLGIELPTSAGLLTTRMEFGIWDRKTGAFGMDKSFIRTSDADFIIGSGTKLILAATNDRAKIIEFGLSDAADNPWGIPRAQFMMTTATEDGAGAGSNVRLTMLYGESAAGGVAPNSRTSMMWERGGFQRVGVGPYLTADLPLGKFEVINAEATIPTVRAVSRRQGSSGKGAFEASLYTPTNPALQFFGQATSDGGTTWTEDAQAYFRMLGDGTMQWGSGGSSSRDTVLSRVAANVLGLSDNDAFRTGMTTTAARPSASTRGKGAQLFDETLNKPIWSNGSAWVDASGATV